MRLRWQGLYASALIALCGMIWVTARFGLARPVWQLAALAGMIAVAALGIWAAHRDLHRKWPAGVSLACAIPVARELLAVLGQNERQLSSVGPASLMIICGTLATIVMAIATLFMEIPTPDVPITNSKLR